MEGSATKSCETPQCDIVDGRASIHEDVDLQSLRGWLDSAADGVFSGWAWSSDLPEVAVVVELLVDGESLAEVLADGFRQDLLDKGIGDGRHAFNLHLDPRHDDGLPHAIQIRIPGTGQLFPVTPIQARLGSAQFGIIGIQNGSVRGWSLIDMHAAACALQLYLDGSPVYQVSADMIHASREADDPRRFFDIPILMQWCGPGMRTLQLYAEIDGNEDHSASYSIHLDPSECRYQGHLEGVADGIVHGWAWDRFADEGATIVELMVDGETVAEAAAADFREDLKESGIGTGHHAFKLQIPLNYRDAKELSIQIRFKGSESIFPSSPVLHKACPKAVEHANDVMLHAEPKSIIGYLDGLQPHCAYGWIFDRASNLPLHYEITVDGNVVATGQADRFRQDLSDGGLGDGSCSFIALIEPESVTLPARVELWAVKDDVRVLVCTRHFSEVQSPVSGQIESLEDDVTREDSHVSADSCPFSGIADASSESMHCQVSSTRFGIISGQCVRKTGSRKCLQAKLLLKDDSGVIVASTRTNRHAPAINEEGEEFFFRLPAWIFDGQNHHLRIVAEDGADVSNGFVNLDGKIKGEGWVEALTPESVSGWAHSYINPQNSPTVDVYVDDVVIGNAVASIFRPDLSSKTLGHGFNGFDIKFRKRLDAMSLRRLRLVIRDSQTLIQLDNQCVETAVGELLRSTSNSQRNAFLQPAIMGNLDHVDRHSCRGWAMDANHPGERLLIDILVNGVVVATAAAGIQRNDLAQKFGTDGRHGFSVELPYGMGLSQNTIVVARCRKTGDLLKSDRAVFNLRNSGKAHCEVAPVNAAAMDGLNSRLYRVSAGVTPSVDLIVLNRDGERHLERLFSSFKKYNSYKNYRLVIIDHSSSDNSYLTSRRWSRELNIKFVNRGRNFSFSESNNYGADISNAELLIFLNNDIIFCQDILGRMVSYMEDPEIGLLGVRLLSPPNQFLEGSQTIVFDQGLYTQHLGIQFSFSKEGRPFLPYEVPYNELSMQYANSPWQVVGVTAALMMTRRTDFLKIGGFHEEYFYGFEDVDFCLSAFFKLGKAAVCANDLVAFHQRAASRAIQSESIKRRIDENKRVLERRFGTVLLGVRHQEWLTRNRLFQLERPEIAFLVSRVDLEGPEADFFTAFELAEAISEEVDVNVTYLEREQWDDLARFDVVVSLLPHFNPESRRSAMPYQIVIAWPRNHFDTWLSLPYLDKFDDVWCGSDKAASAFSRRLGRPFPTIRIATNAKRFQNAEFDPMFKSDYVFTGSFFKAPRQFMSCVRPDELPWEFAIYGHNWEEVEWLRPYYRGSLAYTDMVKVYGSTKVVVDDANHTVVNWGSVNSRVFDALTAGALVVTNSRLGSEEVFNGLLPVYCCAEDLKEILTTYLEDESKRQELVRRLQQIVLGHHTYKHRAEKIRGRLEWLGRSLRINLASSWSNDSTDTTFTIIGMVGDAVTSHGHRARRSNHGAAEKSLRFGDDAVIEVGRYPGPPMDVEPYQPHCYICTSLSPWDHGKILVAYDVVIVMTPSMKKKISQRVACAVESLFESDEAFDQAIIRRSSREWVIRDLNAFQDRVNERLGAHINQWAEDQTDATRVPDSERFSVPDPVGDSAHPEVAFRGSVFFYPDYRATNPYQTMMYKGLERHFDIRPGNVRVALKELEETGRPVVFHLHWTSVVVGLSESRPETEDRVAVFLQELRALVRAGGSLVWTIHNTVSHESRFPDIEAALCRDLAELASFIHVHSLSVAQLTAKHYALPMEKLVVGPHGNYIGAYPDSMDSASARARLGIPSNALVYLFLGQVRRYKGIEDLLEAFGQLLGHSPEGMQPWLVIAGKPFNFDPSDLLRPASGLRNIIVNLREIPDDELQIYLRSADFMVLPYRQVLTSGSVYLSLSYGVPVIAPNKGLIMDVVENGVSGFLYDSNDSSGLFKVLEETAVLPVEKRRQLARGALDRAQSLTWDRMQTVLSRAFAAGTVPRARVENLRMSGGDRRIVLRQPLADPGFNPRVAVVILHYAHLDDTIRCATSVVAQDFAQFELYLVSNDETPEAFLGLATLFPHAVVIQSPRNLGYAGGNNLALELVRKSNVDYALLLNPDAVLPDGALRRLVARADTFKKADIFGPRVVFGDKPTTVWFGGGMVHWESGLETEHLHIGKPVNTLPDHPIEVDYITGACLLARRQLMDRIGLIPEDYFLYFEETDWCLRAKEAGAAIITFPDIEVLHYKRSEADGRPTLYFLYYYCRNALIMTARYSPGKMRETEARICEKAAQWFQVISQVAPAELDTARRAVDCGIADGLAGVVGYIDLSERLALPSHA